jgi:hypothetical protein
MDISCLVFIAQLLLDGTDFLVAHVGEENFLQVLLHLF